MAVSPRPSFSSLSTWKSPAGIIVIAEPRARITPKVPREICSRCFLNLMSKVCTRNSSTHPKANAPWRYIENGALKVPAATGSRKGFANPVKTAKTAITPIATKNKDLCFFVTLFRGLRTAFNIPKLVKIISKFCGKG